MDNESKEYIIMLAKVEWYEELLQLEPHSKLFLPYARLLFEFGKNENSPNYYEQATTILRDGLEIHQDFMEARLFLIEVLHHCGQADQCGIEVARLASLFLSYPDFWDAWREHVILENDRTDLSVALGFMGALIRDKSLTLKDIFDAGLSSISPNLNLDHLQENASSLVSQDDDIENFEAQKTQDATNITCNVTEGNLISEKLDLNQAENKDFELPHQDENDILFLEQQIMEAADLNNDVDSDLLSNIPDKQDAMDESFIDESDFLEQGDTDFTEFSAKNNEGFLTENNIDNFPEDDADMDFSLEGKGVDQDIMIEPAIIGESIDISNDFSSNFKEKENASPQEMLASLLSDSNIIVEPMNSSPFRTRSMAEVLVEQGNNREAIEIYQELISKAEKLNSKNEIIDLKERLRELEMRINNIDLKDNLQFENENLDEIVIEDSEPKPTKEKKIKIQASVKDVRNIEEKSNVKSTQKAVDLLNKLASRLEAKAS